MTDNLLTKIIMGVLGLALLAACVVFGNGCGEDWDPGFFCKGSADIPVYTADSVEAQEQYIINGTLSTDRRATVFVRSAKGSCSGVAMDPYVVFTAAHCVAEGEMTVALDPTSYRIAVDDRYIHRAYVSWPDWDIAVLHLAEPIEGPFPVGIYDPAEGGYAPDIRYYCTHLVAQGYGRVAEGGPPGLYELEYDVGEVRWLTLVTAAAEDSANSAVCNGDSGSPLYAFTNDRYVPGKVNMWVAGIASTGSPDGCVGRGEHVFLENMSPWLREVRYCLNGGEDRLWDFYAGNLRGSTCEELRK